MQPLQCGEQQRKGAKQQQQHQQYQQAFEFRFSRVRHRAGHLFFFSLACMRFSSPSFLLAKRDKRLAASGRRAGMWTLSGLSENSRDRDRQEGGKKKVYYKDKETTDSRDG